MPKKPGRFVPPRTEQGEGGFEVQTGPWVGMRASGLLGTHDPEYVALATNCRSIDPIRGGAYVPLPLMVSETIAGPGVAKLQLLGLYEKRGTPLGIAIIDGQVYSYNGAWTLALTQAQLLAGGITLSAAAPCYGVTYANVYVITDGVNPPFTWDGTVGAGLVKLTNAPTKVFGQPTVYYGKLFFIKDVAAAGADRSTIVWSEEATPNTGYEAGGFKNAWTLEYSGHGQLYAIAGTNEGLYFFRSTSCGIIRGAVNATFVTAGTADSVSESLGTTSPRGVMAYGDYVYAVTMDGRPYRIDAGGTVHPLWYDLLDFVDIPVNTGTIQGRASWAPAPSVNGVILYAGAALLAQQLPGIAACLLFDVTTGRVQCNVEWAGSLQGGLGNDAGARLFSSADFMVAPFFDSVVGGGLTKTPAAGGPVQGAATKRDVVFLSSVLPLDVQPALTPLLITCFDPGDAQSLLQADEFSCVLALGATLTDLGEIASVVVSATRDEYIDSLLAGGLGVADTIALPGIAFPFVVGGTKRMQHRRVTVGLRSQVRRLFVLVTLTTAPVNVGNAGYAFGPQVLRGRLVPIGPGRT